MAAVAACVFVFSWFFRFNDPDGGFAGLTDDHFFYLLRGWQILLGEIPIRDFVDHGAPLYFYVSAAVQVLFGRGTLPELAFSTTMIALGAGTDILAGRACVRLDRARPARCGVPDSAGAALLQLPKDSCLHSGRSSALVARRPARDVDRSSGLRSSPLAVFCSAMITACSWRWQPQRCCCSPTCPGESGARHALLYGVLVVALAAP